MHTRSGKVYFMNPKPGMSKGNSTTSFRKKIISKVKKIKSLSKTLTKKKEDLVNNSFKGDDTEVHHMIFTVRKANKSVVGPPVFYRTFNSGRFESSGPNLQTINEWSIGNYAQWNTSTGTGFSGEQSYKRWFDLNPAQGFAGGNFWTAATAPAGDSFYLQSCAQSIHLLNNTNVPISVSVQYFLALANNANGILTSSAAAYSENIGVGADTYTTVTAPTTTTDTFGAANIDIRGTHIPYSMEPFKSRYKLLKRHDFEMDAAGRYIVKANIRTNQLVTLAEFSGLSGTAYKKGQLKCAVLINGSMVVDTGNAGESVYAITGVNCLVDTTYKFRQIKEKPVNVGRRVINAIALPGGSTIATEKFMEDGLMQAAQVLKN